MRTRIAVLVGLTLGLAFLVGSLTAGGATSSRITSKSDLVPRSVVPSRVQRAIKKHSPGVAYVPTRLPQGYSYLKYASYGHNGFNLSFTCCDDNMPLIGFDAYAYSPKLSCSQLEPAPAKTFRIDGVVIKWSLMGNHEQTAWRCLRNGRGRVRISVFGERPHSEGLSWRTPRQLARMVASTRPIG
jgi:hypothetical protein